MTPHSPQPVALAVLVLVRLLRALQVVLLATGTKVQTLGNIYRVMLASYMM
jgi:hypothetical protein